MTIREFIRKNRAELDEAIKRQVPNIRHLDDDERYQWILNDEGLYNWARGEGVSI